MNKLLFLLACIAMAALVAVGAAFAFAPAPHEHVYTSETTEPTCVADGVTTFTCACGETYTENTPALGHTEEDVAAKDATCTATGLTAGKKCTVCGETTVAQETIPALGHDEVVHVAVSPTCTETGLTGGAHCTRCDYVVEQNEIPALGHEMVTDAAVAPNCNDSGLTEGSHCTRCDYKVEQEYIPALGHDVKTIASVAPTCTESGLNQGYYCARCDGYQIKQDVLPAKGHAYDNDDDVICNVCNFERVLPCKHPTTQPIGDAKEANCTEDGITEGLMCTVCEEVLVAQEVLPKFGHASTSYEGKDATCTEAGYKAYETCSRCGLNTYEELPALGHDIKIDVAVAPSCTASGLSEGSHCARCDYRVAQNVVPALGHTVVTDAAVAAKCYTTGLTEGSHCSVCNVVLVEQTATAALGAHTWAGTTCSTCNAYKFEAETFEITNMLTDKGMIGTEGKGAAATNYPSGDGFIYNLQYATTSTIKFEVNSSVAQSATLTLCMGCRQYTVSPSETFVLKVNGVEVAFNESVFPTESSSSIRYYDWVELAVANIQLNAGNNVIEFVRTELDRALNFDYVSVCPTVGTVSDPREVDGHVYDWTFSTLPDYENAGEVTGYCKYCRNYREENLPVVSVENGYTKISTGVMSTWEYSIDGNKLYIDVAEEAEKYMFDVSETDGIFTSVSNAANANGTYKTSLMKNSYGIFYELTQSGTFTLEVSVDEAADVAFILRVRSTANVTFQCKDIISSIYVTNGGETVASEIRNDSVTFLGWEPDKTIDAEVALISLKPGKNVITFTMGVNNINISGVGFSSFVPVEHEPVKVYGGNIATFDPFLTENGGTITLNGDSSQKINNGGIESYYQNNRKSTFTITVKVDEPTTIKLRLGLAFNYSSGYTTNTQIATITSANASGKANNVLVTNKVVKNTKWTVAAAVISEMATIELDAGVNTITIAMYGNNINITGVYIASTNEIVFGKND